MTHSMAHNISNNERGFVDPYKNEPFLDQCKNEVGGKIRFTKNSTHKGRVGSLEAGRGSLLKSEDNKGSGKKVRRRGSIGSSSNYSKENSASKTRNGGENRSSSNNNSHSNHSSQEPRSAHRRGRRVSSSGAIDTSVCTTNTDANKNRSDANGNNYNTEINNSNNYNVRSSQSNNDDGGQKRTPRRGRRNSISGSSSTIVSPSNHKEIEKGIDDYDDDSASIFSDPHSNKPFLQKAKLRMEFPNTRLKGVIESSSISASMRRVSPSEGKKEEKEQQHHHSSSSNGGRRKGSGRRQRRNSIGACNNVELAGVGSGSRHDSHREDPSFLQIPPPSPRRSNNDEESVSASRKGGRDRSSAKVGVDFIKSIASSSHPHGQEEPQQRRSRHRRSSISGGTVPVTPTTPADHYHHNDHTPVVRAPQRRIRRGSMSNATDSSPTNSNSTRSFIQSLSSSSPTGTSSATHQQQQPQQPRRRRRRNSIGASSIPSTPSESPLSKRNILKLSRTSAALVSSSVLGYGSSSSSSIRGGSRKTGSRRRGSLGASTVSRSSDTKKYSNGISTFTIEGNDNTDDSQLREKLLKKMYLLNRTINEFSDAANERLSTVVDLKVRMKNKSIQYEGGMHMHNEGSSSSNGGKDNHSRRSYNNDKHVQKMEQFYKKAYRDNTKKMSRLKKDNKDKTKSLSKLHKELEKRIEHDDKKFRKDNSIVSSYQTKADKIQKEVMVVTTLKNGLSISVNNLSEENKELANSVDKYQRLCENESLVRLEFQKTVFDVAQLVRTRCESKALKKEIKSIILRCDKSSKKIIANLSKYHGKRFEIIKDSSYASSYNSASSP